MANIVLGVTGGIAAYKATGIIRALSEAGHSVRVIPTQNALRFIGATTLEALSHNAIDPDLYTDVADVKHVAIGQEADLIIIAPATAAFLARYATGLADDLLLNTLLVATAPILVAPAMHTEMWAHDSTRANVATLRSRGVHVLEPAVGRLTGPDTGAGRLPEPDEIVAAALALLEPQDLVGKIVTITAGGTREPIDAARYIGNYSSGKQGAALAAAALARGATVRLIGANMPSVAGVEYIPVATAVEMQEALRAAATSSDLIICAAAVADYRVETTSESKLKKAVLGDSFDLRLVQNPDLLAEAVQSRKPGQVIVGFAAETAASARELETIAQAKLAFKGCDLLVANDVSGGKTFGADATEVLIVNALGPAKAASGSKLEVAHRILDAAAALA
jgi:phosphopantothenoylcysteine decarboxylase/phosphopantothenate--cysteine ligase